MKRAKNFKRLIVTASSLMLLLLCFQNCADMFSQTLEFASTEELLNELPCSTFDQSDEEYVSCAEQKSGLLGRLYYLEDRTDGVTKPQVLYTKYDEPLPFNGSALSSVNVIISRGYVSETFILMPEVAVPKISFTEGFKIGNDEYLVDRSGKKLIEAFALDLFGNLHLPPNQSPGIYEAALISDDGSILDIDLNSNGNYETIIDNDGNHSSQMKCSSKFFSLERNSMIPLRLRYYQGPRTEISLTLMLRQVMSSESVMPSETDLLCNKTVSSDFVEVLQERGWFIPTRDAFTFPSPSQLTLFQSN